MNSTNLYITASKVIINSDQNNPESWRDLYRLLPYLRNSLCCVVCLNLLIDPYTPDCTLCQHHLCKQCRGGKKKIKPGCPDCKESVDYSENRRLKAMLQMYKQMCMICLNSDLFHAIKTEAQSDSTFSKAANNAIHILKEGATFQDNYKSKGGLPKETYSILPFVHTNSLNSGSAPVVPLGNSRGNSAYQVDTEPPKNLTLKTVPSNNIMYSVVYPGTGNKITIKRKPATLHPAKNKSDNEFRDAILQNMFFKRPFKPKKGCRCGNATINPGKLTCCGQRCPCYVQGRTCIACKCRGCRNPHRLDGHKMLPYVSPLESAPHMVQSESQPSQTVQSLPASSAFSESLPVQIDSGFPKLEPSTQEELFLNSMEPLEQQIPVSLSTSLDTAPMIL